MDTETNAPANTQANAIKRTPAELGLTVAQQKETSLIAQILKVRIEAKGTFAEPLKDQAYTYAKSQGIDVYKAENVLRNQFQVEFGQTLNEVRESFLETESRIDDRVRAYALDQAHKAIGIIAEGKTPFYLAQDSVSDEMVSEFGITQSIAKLLIKETYKADTGREFYDDGKAMEAQAYQPRRENRQQSRQTVSRGYSPSRA